MHSLTMLCIPQRCRESRVVIAQSFSFSMRTAAHEFWKASRETHGQLCLRAWFKTCDTHRVNRYTLQNANIRRVRSRIGAFIDWQSWTKREHSPGALAIPIAYKAFRLACVRWTLISAAIRNWACGCISAIWRHMAKQHLAMETHPLQNSKCSTLPAHDVLCYAFRLVCACLCKCIKPWTTNVAIRISGWNFMQWNTTCKNTFEVLHSAWKDAHLVLHAYESF